MVSFGVHTQPEQIANKTRVLFFPWENTTFGKSW